MTIGDAITAALQDLGLLVAGEAPSAEDSALGLARVNDWLDALASEGLALYGRTRTTWTLTPSVSTYAVGTGQTVNVSAPTGPEAIEHVGYIDTSVSPSNEVLLGRPLTEGAYAAIPQKALTATVPSAWYYRHNGGTGSLIAWPVPTSATLQGVLYTATAISEFAALTDVLALPNGYRRFIRSNLAVELAPAFGVQPNPVTVEIAVASKATVKRANLRVSDLSLHEVSSLGARGGLSVSRFDAGGF